MPWTRGRATSLACLRHAQALAPLTPSNDF